MAIEHTFSCFFIDGQPKGVAEVIAWVGGFVGADIEITVCEGESSWA